jgi:hypothetical protein
MTGKDVGVHTCSFIHVACTPWYEKAPPLRSELCLRGLATSCGHHCRLTQRPGLPLGSGKGAGLQGAAQAASDSAPRLLATAPAPPRKSDTVAFAPASLASTCHVSRALSHGACMARVQAQLSKPEGNLLAPSCSWRRLPSYARVL